MNRTTIIAILLAMLIFTSTAVGCKVPEDNDISPDVTVSDTNIESYSGGRSLLTKIVGKWKNGSNIFTFNPDGTGTTGTTGTIDFDYNIEINESNGDRIMLNLHTVPDEFTGRYGSIGLYLRSNYMIFYFGSPERVAEDMDFCYYTLYIESIHEDTMQWIAINPNYEALYQIPFTRQK